MEISLNGLKPARGCLHNCPNCCTKVRRDKNNLFLDASLEGEGPVVSDSINISLVDALWVEESKIPFIII